MSEPLEPHDDFGEIRRLVSAETAEALRRFRAGDFEAKLRSRIAAGERVTGGSPKGFLGLRPLAVRAAAAVFVLLLAGGAFLVFRRGPQEGGGETAMFVKAVGMLPGLESVTAGLPHETGPAPAAGSPMARVLGRAYEERKAEEEGLSPAAGPAAPHLSLMKKMEILFKDRALERVLLSIHEKFKEV